MTLNRRANRRRFANVGTSWSFSQRLTVAVCTPTSLATSDWPEPLSALHDLAAFELFDVWRAAVLDVAIQNTDRGNNNWMGMGPDIAGTFHLKLVDHAHAFEGGPVNSSFVTFVGGGPATATVRDEITVGLNRWPADRLSELVGTAAEAVQERLKAVAAGTRIADVT